MLLWYIFNRTWVLLQRSKIVLMKMHSTTSWLLILWGSWFYNGVEPGMLYYYFAGKTKSKAASLALVSKWLSVLRWTPFCPIISRYVESRLWSYNLFIWIWSSLDYVIQIQGWKVRKGNLEFIPHLFGHKCDRLMNLQ